jgi:prepilin signal peptidase PulO-like enzyme (type II secretory pathway)
MIWIIGIGLYMLGAAFGSFGWVLIERLGDEKITRADIRWLLRGRSSCPSCHHTLTASELIPIISQVTQRGHCTQCHQSIPRWYLVLEVLSGLVFVSSYLWWMSTWSDITSLIVITSINRLLLLILIHDRQTQYLHLPLYSILTTIAILITLFSPILYQTGITLLARGGAMLAIWRLARIYAQHRYSMSEWIGMGDVLIVSTLSILVPTTVILLWFDRSLYLIIYSFLLLIITASISTLIMAACIHRTNSGQTIAFLPWLIIGWWIITWIIPFITSA